MNNTLTYNVGAKLGVILLHSKLLYSGRDAAVRFGPVQGNFPPNLKLDRRSGSPNSLNPELDLDEPVQMVRFRLRVI
jgi:hypothetical protein